ncbi:MAG: hypothetical protein PHD43_23135 [Methylococcales bacterium]|jgi:ABC-type uncharacterized transport system auxiliary subunit|nr:hypothetical protein [Methylococcales bacterium]
MSKFLLLTLCCFLLAGCNQKILDKKVYALVENPSTQQVEPVLKEHIHFGQTSVAYWSSFNNASLQDDSFKVAVGSGEQRSDPNTVKAIGEAVGAGLKTMLEQP